ncbi:MAG: Na/Pi cotransporter family protein [Oscillospiraceae bacterium]|nr:Na/Pi cotransporter family protein [Oscillospiraceae bacterium]
MSISNVIALLGGVALFLFGMGLMSDGLKQVAGNKLEVFLYKLSNTPLKGILLGTAVTIVIQSSAATSVMVVGFVNSGMMKLAQAIGIILGSFIGTSITGWVVSLSAISGSGWLSLVSTATLTGLVAIVGILLRMIGKKAWKKDLGMILLGFAVLMYGISAMSGAVSPLKESPAFVSIMTAFSNPLLGFVAGVAITAILQSASSAVGLLQTLSVTGAISFSAALPLVLGIGVGASVPVLMSSIGANTEARRSAWSYPIISLLGAIVVGVLFYGLNALVHFAFAEMTMDMVSIAILNTVFRVISALVLFPLMKVILRLLERLVKQREEVSKRSIRELDERLLANPVVALNSCGVATKDMSEIVSGILARAMGLLVTFEEDGFADVETGEGMVDEYEDMIGSYLVKLTGSELRPEESRKAAKFLHTIGDLERIGDHAMNIAQCAREIKQKNITFSPPAEKELRVMSSAVTEIVNTAFHSLSDGDLDKAYRVEPLEELIDNLCDEMKLHHVRRLEQHVCTLDNGFVFNDLATNFERIGDHCSNIAVAMIELESGSFDTHAYLETLKAHRDEAFSKYYEGFRAKYSFD